ncbi:MAG: type II secretion system protein [Nitrosomonadales bacterium]|nr:type II secretion system protein [Nitrosomonadales bacterium]
MTIMRKTGFKQGYTLVELVNMVAIVSLLSSVVLLLSELSVKQNKECELHLALREIRTALDAYRQAVTEGRIAHSLGDSGYPPSLRSLTDGSPDITSPDKKKMIYFLRHIPRDPMFDDSTKANEETWGKLRYTSSADSQTEGDDVFDVYSQSLVVGLNGIQYRNW